MTSNDIQNIAHEKKTFIHKNTTGAAETPFSQIGISGTKLLTTQKEKNDI